MLCSISTGKPGPNWLDRLRSSKGFPPHHAGLDLDHFLLLPHRDDDPHNPSDPPDLPPTPKDPTPATGTPPLRPPQQKVAGERKKEEEEGGEKGKEWFDLVSTALAELFHMGDPRDLMASREGRKKRKKSARKQRNPRICVVSAPASDDGSCPAEKKGAYGGGVPPALSPPSAENSTAGAKKRSNCRTKLRRKRAVRGGTSDPSDLSAYSRTEVTVIDTSSSPTWKSEKLIFRKGVVWKVRDKKSWNASRKKRKLGLVDRLVGEKEQEELPSARVKEIDKKEYLTSSAEGCPHNGRRDASKEISNDRKQAPERRTQFSRSSRKPAAKGSSVFRLRVIPTGRKNGISCPRSSFKGK